MRIQLTAIIDYAIPEGATDSKPRQLLSLAENVIVRANGEGQFTTLHAATVRSIQYDSRLVSEDVSGYEKLCMACERIEDLLKADDGQAYKEAQKFLDLHAPKKLRRPSTTYQTMEEIIKELDPAEQVIRSWLQGRGVFISQQDDARVVVLSHMPAFKDKERIAEMRDVYRFAFANGKRWPTDLAPDASSPEEITDGILRQLYTSGFNDGIRERDSVVKCDKCGSSSKMIKQEDGSFVCHATHPIEMSPARFPAFATIEGSDGMKTAVARSGAGLYYRQAGAWEIECKHDEQGVLRACPSSKHLKHITGRELVECTQEFHDIDNGLNQHDED